MQGSSWQASCHRSTTELLHPRYFMFFFGMIKLIKLSPLSIYIILYSLLVSVFFLLTFISSWGRDSCHEVVFLPMHISLWISMSTSYFDMKLSVGWWWRLKDSSTSCVRVFANINPFCYLLTSSQTSAGVTQEQHSRSPSPILHSRTRPLPCSEKWVYNIWIHMATLDFQTVRKLQSIFELFA